MKAIVLALVMVGLVGCGTKSLEDKPAATKSGPMSREAFEAILKGCSNGSEMVEKLGRPSRTTETAENLILVYDNKTMNPITGKPDLTVQITLDSKDIKGKYLRHSY
jgi:hypothetical protein